MSEFFYNFFALNHPFRYIFIVFFSIRLLFHIDLSFYFCDFIFDLLRCVVLLSICYSVWLCRFGMIVSNSDNKIYIIG